MSVRPNTNVRVELTTYANFLTGNPTYESVKYESVTWDALPITVKVPTFSVTIPDSGGLFQYRYKTGDIVRITRNGKLVFLGIINTATPTKGDSQKYTLEGDAYYYHVLLKNLTVGRDAFKEGGKPNIWRFGRKVLGTDEELVDGLRPDEIIKALLGYKLYAQEFFDNLDAVDNTDWLSPSVTDVTTDRLENPSFEDANIGNWNLFSYLTSTSIFTDGLASATNVTSVGAIDNNAFDQDQSYKFTTSASFTVPAGTIIGLYQDDVLLSADDIVTFRAKLVSASNSKMKMSLYIFKNRTFQHPFNDKANTPEIVSHTIVGLSSTYGRVGGPLMGAVERQYRVAVAIKFEEATTTTYDIRLDDVRVVHNGNFQGVILSGGFLQLRPSESVIVNDQTVQKFRQSGFVRSISFYHLNPNVKQPGAINGTIQVRILGSVYKDDDDVVWHPKMRVAIDDGVIWATNADANEVTLTATDPLIGGTLTDEEISIGGQDILWTGSINTADLLTSGDIDYKLRYEIELNSDGYGTTQIDYLKVEADTETFLREVTDISPWTYAGDFTAPYLGSIDEYVYPPEFTSDPVTLAKHSTFAVEFFYETILDALTSTIQATIKPSAITLTDPVTVTVEPQDANWDLRIDHTGEVTFKPHLGRYYGQQAGDSIKEFSFREQNLKQISPKRLSGDIVNNLTFIAEGIPTLDALTLDGSAFIDAGSVATYGMRIGVRTEKNITDIAMADNRARAVLRQLSTPSLSVDVEVLDTHLDTWDVGDIIYIHEPNVGISEDLRVVDKKYSISSAGEKIQITLSTKNRSIESFVARVSSKVRDQTNNNQGSSAVNPNNEVPKLISKEVIYPLFVEIPETASRSLQRVLLNCHTESAVAVNGTLVTSVTIGPSGAHVHGDGSHTHTMDANFFGLRGNRDTSTSQLVFPTNIILSINDATGTGIVEEATTNVGPYGPFGARGVNPFGDLSDSQTLGIGFRVDDMDISDIFKDSTGSWVPGSYILYFISRGQENASVNKDNLGIISASVRMVQTV